MESSKPQFSFTGQLESVRLNVQTTAVYLPHHIIAELPKGRIRVSGTINGAPFSLAIRFRKDGSRYFTVGSTLRNAARVGPGDNVDIRFRVLDINSVEPPAVLEVVAHEEHEVKSIGRLFSKPGKQILEDYISNVKNMDVRLRRSIDNVRKGRIATGLQPHHQRRNKKG